MSKEHTPIRLSEKAGGASWLPYSIFRRDDQVVVRGGLFNYLSGPLMSADNDRSAFMPTYGREAIPVTKLENNLYQIGECGFVCMEGDAWYFIRQDGKFIFRAEIPNPAARDVIFTGLAHFGAAMSNAGG